MPRPVPTAAYATLAVGFVVLAVVVVLNATGAPGGGPHALLAGASVPGPVPPGGSGTLDWTVTNTGPGRVQGILVNASLPPYVTVPPDPHCQRTGSNDGGGVLVSCNFSDPAGVLAAGANLAGRVMFRVDADAPPGTGLGTLGVLVVPLCDGEPVEDFTDLSGPNTVWIPIATS